MENEIVVALISSATSLFVAFGALWQSMRVANKQSSTEESLKLIAEASARAKPGLHALSIAWANLQRIKHGLDVLLLPTRANAAEALGALDDAVNDLQKQYEAHGSVLPDYLRQAWHDAKNYSMSLRASVHTMLDGLKVDDILPRETQAQLDRARGHITAFQASIKDGRDHYVIDELGAIAALLSHAKTR